MKAIKQVVIVDTKSQGNNFGDRSYEVTVEFREGGQVKATKTFKDTAFEGEHDSVKRLMTMEIKKWAKTNGTRFTGWV